MGKCSKEWNSKLDDNSICPIDFEWDVDNLHIMSNSSVNTLPNTEEIQYSEIYMTAIENQTNEWTRKLEKARSVLWRKRYQPIMHLSWWVVSQKTKNEENVTKVRLHACSFKEIKDFPTDSPCCSRIGVWSIFVSIASQQLK